MDAGQRNYVGLIYECAQRKGWTVRFDLVNTDGPEHIKTFIMSAVLNDKSYPEGVGRKKKEAKQNAAKNAFEVLENDEQKEAQLSSSELKDTGYSGQNSDFSQISSTFSMSESSDGVSLSQKISKNDSKSESIVFTSSSPSATANQQPTNSRFLEEFTKESITRIGKGGYGRVFKARRKLEDTNFAVKIVKYNEKACREVKALSRLEHPNIVRYHTSWTEETEYRAETSETHSISSSGVRSEFLYIQMEFCEGKTLLSWIKKRNNHPKKYPERRREAAEIIKQVLEAVKYVHLKKLFHRDLKPENIMVGHEGGVKVVDFGLVTKEEGNDNRNPLERTKRAGTRSYMSPEQRQHKTDYCKKVDIYAVGLIYFELLWRFATQTEREKLWDDIRSKKFPEEFSKRFGFQHKLIERMLCENPEGRPEASDLLTELEQHYATTASTEHNAYKRNRTY
ncbi:hypothetical protein AMELA_G00043960 [Ameiurus melas]|uniref:non-specific serine/threonine protein kinase n=1 Tax=Ameiurus melas TaxID=219545 RepID=A0A7J6B6A9_AMEME|nr:hypothetical protein AMELA_G00043960 [Ameiurus melas]